MPITALVPLLTFQAFLIFCRLGAAIFVFPALSDPAIPARARLLLAGAITLIFLPILQVKLPVLPTQTSQLVAMVIAELMVGLLLGISAKFFMSALSVTGELIAFMAGFQSATLFDPQSGASSPAPTLFLTLIGGVLVLATGLHHALITGVMQSYDMFTPGKFPAMNDATQAIVHLTEAITKLGLQLAAPVVIAGFLTNLAFGIFNRLIPQIQVYFLSVPASIVLSVLLLAFALTSLFTLFVGQMQDNLFISQIDTSGE